MEDFKASFPSGSLQSLSEDKSWVKFLSFVPPSPDSPLRFFPLATLILPQGISSFLGQEALTSTIACLCYGDPECIWWILAFPFSPSKDGGALWVSLSGGSRNRRGERPGVAAKGGNTGDSQISNITGTGREGGPVPAHSFSKCLNVHHFCSPARLSL